MKIFQTFFITFLAIILGLGLLGLSNPTPTEAADTWLPSKAWLGLTASEIDEEQAQAFGISQPAGLLIVKTIKDGPAEKGGLHKGDLILEYNGLPIKNGEDLPLFVGATTPGSVVLLKIIRDSKPLVLSVELGERNSGINEISIKQPGPEKQIKLLEESLRLIVMLEGTIDDLQVFGAGLIMGSYEDRLYIATANHIVRKGDRVMGNIRVKMKAFPKISLKAERLAQFDEDLDLALLTTPKVSQYGISPCSFPFNILVKGNVFQRGTEVFPVGCPNGVPWGMPVAPDLIANFSGDTISFQSSFIGVGHSGGG